LGFFKNYYSFTFFILKNLDFFFPQKKFAKFDLGKKKKKKKKKFQKKKKKEKKEKKKKKKYEKRE